MDSSVPGGGGGGGGAIVPPTGGGGGGGGGGGMVEMSWKCLSRVECDVLLTDVSSINVSKAQKRR